MIENHKPQILALGLLAVMAFTTPSMLDALSTPVSASTTPAASSAFLTASADTALSGASTLTASVAAPSDDPTVCPAGYTCTPNPRLTVSSVVLDGPSPTIVSYRFTIAGVDHIDVNLSANNAYANIPGFSATVTGSRNSALGKTTLNTRGKTIAEFQVTFANKTGKDVLVGLKAVGYSGNKQVGGDADALTIAGIPAKPLCPYGYTCTQNPQANITASVDSSSPTAGLIQVSSTAQTQNVVLGIYDLKSSGAPSILSTLKVNVFTSLALPAELSNIQIKAAGLTYSVSSLGSPTTFSNMTIPLPADTYIPVTVMGTIVQNNSANALSGATISTSLVANGTDIVALDSAFNAVPVTSSTSTSATLQLAGSAAVAGNFATTYGGLNANPNSGSTTQQFTFGFSVTAGNDPIFISKNVGSAFNVNAISNGMSFANASFTDVDTSGDASSYFYIAPGQTKAFSAVYIASGLNSSSGTYQMNVIHYGTTSSGTGSSITSGDMQNGLKAILFH